MRYNRQAVIHRLINSRVETITQWALQNRESLYAYVAMAEDFSAMDDDTLRHVFITEFDEDFDTECQFSTIKIGEDFWHETVQYMKISDTTGVVIRPYVMRPRIKRGDVFIFTIDQMVSFD